LDCAAKMNDGFTLEDLEEQVGLEMTIVPTTNEFLHCLRTDYEVVGKKNHHFDYGRGMMGRTFRRRTCQMTVIREENRS